MTAVVNEHEAGPGGLDVYALLGMTPEAMPALARQLHHERVERLRDRLEQGDPEAMQAVEKLNEALALVLDARRRAEYNRMYYLVHARTTEEDVPRLDRARRVQIGAATASLALTLIAILVAWMLVGSLAALIIGALGLVAAITVAAWPVRAVEDPFAVLGLTRDASRHHVDLAYDLLTQEQLQRLQHGIEEDGSRFFARLRGKRRLARRLELLDRARIRAKQEQVERYVETSLPPPGSLVRLRRDLAALPRRLALGLGDTVIGAPGRLRAISRSPEPPEE